VPARPLRCACDDAPGLAQLKFWIASKSFVTFATAFTKFAAVQQSWRDSRIAQRSCEHADPRCRKNGRLGVVAIASTRTMEAMMNQHAVVNKFSHVKPGDTEFTGGGLRDFFLYRDLGIAAATGGQVICHLVKANPEMPPVDGTGWHRHDCDFQIVIMTKGWARFMYEDKPTLVQAGDVVHQRPGIVHYLYDYSPDMEYLEIVSPADFKTVDMPPATDKVPPVTPWK
jgi:mannose-6-phosphate isomerase-like protein (cupin superfamily)